MVAASDPPLAFFQEPIKTAFWYAVDVMTFGIDVFFAVVDTAMMEFGCIQHIVNLKTVCVDDAIRFHSLTNDLDQHAGLLFQTTFLFFRCLRTVQK